ncbi:MAG: BglII/BstYI family type II restriction endonuclease [Sulfuricaulis sp.]|uniref:BglII/BstYI family type II restriction endonuclease n=1 Tax=Sulfuricaulis sp. TaxID=2003553 RepID=UPI0034A368C8
MKIVETYSHMNGGEYLSVRKPIIYTEIRDAIACIDSKSGKFRDTFRKFFDEKGWKVSCCFCYGGGGNLQKVAGLSLSEQRRFLERTGICNPIKSSMKIGLVKDRVAVETPLRKSLGIQNTLLKQLLFYSSDIIDVGVEILPMKTMEREVYNILRHGRNSPPVPLLVIGIVP